MNLAGLFISNAKEPLLGAKEVKGGTYKLKI